MMTKDDCMLLAGLAKICELDGETEIPRALLDLAARMSDSIGEEQMAVTLRKMRDAIKS